MKILVVTMTCNRLQTTQQWLGSLRETTDLPYRHVVVDNGSTDGTASWLIESGYETLALPENRGIMAGWIMGWELAIETNFRPDVVVKYDDDVEVITPNLLDRLVAFVGEGRRAVAAPYNIDHGHVPSPLSDPCKIAGETVVPTRLVGGMLAAMPGTCFAKLAKIGGVKGDLARGDWWLKHGYQPYYLTDLKASHHGRATIDRQTHGGYQY